MTLEERKREAGRLHAAGYNCAQSVIMVFPDKTGVDMETAARAGAALGAGATFGDTCGVITGMAIATGLHGDGSPQRKAQTYKEMRQLAQKFRDLNSGRSLCRELKTLPGGSPCSILIEQGVEILYNYFDCHE